VLIISLGKSQAWAQQKDNLKGVKPQKPISKLLKALVKN
jgi:hypothetical protein